MISFISGKVLEKTNSFLIVENQGIGYKILVTPDILEFGIGESISLYTYLKVSEDAQTLFGLPDFDSLQFFELLISVTGVGPKMALTILSAAQIDMLREAIAHQDIAIFTRMSGVGKKTAEHIILELKNKVLPTGTLEGPSGSSDVYDALIGLGYSAGEVRVILPKLDTSQAMEGQLKEALKLLAQ
jgi:holliday junction DNA helicase RuvA